MNTADRRAHIIAAIGAELNDALTIQTNVLAELTTDKDTKACLKLLEAFEACLKDVARLADGCCKYPRRVGADRLIGCQARLTRLDPDFVPAPF